MKFQPKGKKKCMDVNDVQCVRTMYDACERWICVSRYERRGRFVDGGEDGAEGDGECDGEDGIDGNDSDDGDDGGDENDGDGEWHDMRPYGDEGGDEEGSDGDDGGDGVDGRDSGEDGDGEGNGAGE